MNNQLQKEISNEESEELLCIIRKHFLNIYKIIYLLDQAASDSFKKRNEYYYHQHHTAVHDHKDKSKKSGVNQSQSCCLQKQGKIYIPEKELSPIERYIHETTNKIEMRFLLPELLNKLGQTFSNIKQSGLNDGNEWTVEAEQFVLNEVMKEGVNQFIIPRIRAKMQKGQASESKQPLLLATPSSWHTRHPKIDLDFLKGESILNLKDNDYCLQSNFINNRDFNRNLFKELTLLEMENRFEEASVSEKAIRNDKMLWLSLSDMNQKDFRNLFFICEILSALPYEFNKKTQFCTQVSELFQISYFPPNVQSYHQKHLDSSFLADHDNGRKFTCLYFVNLDFDNSLNVNVNAKDKSLVRLFKSEDLNNNWKKGNQKEQSVDIPMEGDSLLIFKSRKIASEIISNDQKRFIIRFWCNGPYQPDLHL